MSEDLQNVSPEQARDVLWRAGILRFLLDSNQQGIYSHFYTHQGRKLVLNMSRRLGKSYLLCVLALEYALRNPDSQIKFASPTQRQVKRVIFPLFRQILRSCPGDLKPSWFAQESTYDFPNGSSIAIAGMDAGRSDALRGTDAALALVDEAAFTPSHHLETMVSDVLMPMLLLTGGKIIIASTPAKTPRHAFEVYCNEAAATGNYLHRTIYNNPRITPELIEEFKKEAGGEHTTTWRREYLAEHCVDSDVIVFPEFSKDLQREIVRADLPTPAYCDRYVGADIGFKDATFLVFGYWDFTNARIVIEDESMLVGAKEVRTDLIADVIKDKEQSLWGEHQPYFRVTDIDLRLINDLDKLHGLRFVPVQKNEDRESAVNELRLLFSSRKIFIHPRCKNLIAQLESCVWDEQHRSFERISGYGHFDGVDALIYLIRSVRRTRNPFPAHRYNSSNEFFFEQPTQKTPTAKTIQQLFKIKPFGV